MMQPESALLIRSREEGDEAAIPLADGARLDGRIRWVVTGPKHRRELLARTLPGVSEAVGNAVLLDFGNSVGYFRVPDLGTIEVTSSKWTDEAFEGMLADVCRISSRLPFAARNSGSLPFDRSLVLRRPVLYQLFVYLRYLIRDNRAGDSALVPAFTSLLRNPHRRLRRVERQVPVHLARSVRPSELIAIASGRQPLTPVQPRFRESPLGRVLGGRLPVQVNDCAIEERLDTPENRFAKMLLVTILGVFDEVEQAFRGPSAFDARVVEECHHLRRRIEPIRRAGLWSQVGALRQIPTGSTVLQRRRGYKTLFRCHSTMRLGSQLPLDSKSTRRLLEIRDIAELYELWCFYQCVESAQEQLGPPSRVDQIGITSEGLKIRGGFRVGWSDGISISYSPGFSQKAEPIRRSYSVRLYPDIVIEIPAGPAAGLHLLDAKFRLRYAGERESTFLSDDLHKMHAYRDAIPAARSARVLYPGQVDEFYPISASETWDGVGAVGLLPGRPARAIAEFFRQSFSRLIR